MGYTVWYNYYRGKGNSVKRANARAGRRTTKGSARANLSTNAIGSGKNVVAGRRWQWGWGSGSGTGYNTYTKYKGNRP